MGPRHTLRERKSCAYLKGGKREGVLTFLLWSVLNELTFQLMSPCGLLSQLGSCFNYFDFHFSLAWG